MTYRLRIRWNRLVVMAIATLILSLGLQNWGRIPIKASNIPSEITVAQNVSAAIWAKGSFPVENFQSYTSPFGYRASPVDGQRQFHNGLDLAAPRGSYIRSWWGGK